MKIYCVINEWDNGEYPEELQTRTTIDKVFDSEEKAKAYIDNLTANDLPGGCDGKDIEYEIDGNYKYISFDFKKGSYTYTSNNCFYIEEHEVE